MDTVTYHRIKRSVDAYIEKQTFENISDPFFRKRIAGVMQQGGKRIRPVLCCLGHEFEKAMNENTLTLSLAIELFHNFTLVHDDTMDEAPLRRDRPTVYAEHGRDIALLTGDVMLLETYRVLQSIKSKQQTTLYNKFNDVAQHVCTGQLHDLKQENEQQIWMFEDYVDMIRLKTAVLLGESLRLGFLLAGGEEKQATLIYDLGVECGTLFQIRDDYLDVFGEQKEVGKQRGGDILQRKKNMLYFKAKERLNEKENARLTYLIEVSEDINRVDEVIAIYQKVDTKNFMQSFEGQTQERIQRTLEKLNLDTSKKNILLSLPAFFSRRLK